MGEAPMLKRGPRAWENYDAAPLLPLQRGGYTRLLAHAVSDATASQWLPKLREFLLHCRRSAMTLESSQEIDMALAEHFDWLCYAQRANPSHGTLIFFGMLCVMPELKGRLHLAARSLKSWGKLASNAEGGPMAEEAIFAIAIDMLKQGKCVEGVWTLAQYDAYGREQDIENIRTQDVSFHDGVMALDLGVSSRGESVKTGSNQGVTIRRGVICDLLLGLKELAPAGARLFPIPQAEFRRSWHLTCRRLGLEWAGPPHRIRHSGPSEDIARERSSLEAVRRRGRWKSMTSVQRYSKTFALVKFRARMPPTTRIAGEEIARDLRAAVKSALQSQSSRSPMAATLYQHVCRGKGKDVQTDYSQVRRATSSSPSSSSATSLKRASPSKRAPSRRATRKTEDEYDITDPDEDMWMTE